MTVITENVNGGGYAMSLHEGDSNIFSFLAKVGCGVGIDELILQDARIQRRAGNALRELQRGHRRALVAEAAKKIKEAADWRLLSAVVGSLVKTVFSAVGLFCQDPLPEGIGEKGAKAMDVDMLLTAAVWVGLLGFGWWYNRLAARVRRQDEDEWMSALLVVGGVLTTGIGFVVIVRSMRSALMLFGCFLASGLPMVLGSIRRSTALRARDEAALVEMARRELDDSKAQAGRVHRSGFPGGGSADADADR